MSPVRYPNGYGTEMISLAEMRRRHEVKMHPEFARRFFAYMEHKQGQLGVGGGWRRTQPDRPGFAPDGKSFHQTQVFASGTRGYAAVDLVVPVPGRVHRAPYWNETADAPEWGLHTFIRNPSEPWHIQCIEMRGWQSWVNAGRPDPVRIHLPDTPLPPSTPGGHSVFQKFVRLDGLPFVYAVYSGGYKIWVRDEAELGARQGLGQGEVEVLTRNYSTLFAALGPILGPVPPGVDSHGLRTSA